MASFVTPSLLSHTYRTPGVAGGAGGGGNSPLYGRVVDVILDSTHPRYKALGGSQALYGVFFQYLFSGEVESSTNVPDVNFAYCKQNSLRQIPIRNEIVQLEIGIAGAGIQDRKEENVNVYQEKMYWTSIVPVWNHPHLNIYPDVVRYQEGNSEIVSLGNDFLEDENVKPIQLSPGDVVLEGRHGQSLRFGGTKSSNGTSMSDDESNGKPYTILRNGQASTPGNVCIEDINADDASIYLVSDHRVPLVEANDKFKAAVTPPSLAKDYRGKQIVVNSDRVMVNAREENLGLSAKKHLCANAKEVSIDGEKYIGLDADKIYLGAAAQKELQPVVLGQRTVDLLNNLCTALETLIKIMSISPNEAYSWVSTVKTAATATVQSLMSIKSELDSIKSKKVFTEE